MGKLRLFLVVSVFALLTAACGGGGITTSNNQTPTQPVTVSLSELSTTLEISSTHQFTATVQNADDTSVDWHVNKVKGGNSTAGTISDSGLYTAPDRVPSPVTVTVTAVARADATKEASATVTIMSNVTIAVSPKDTTLPAGEAVQLTATIDNAKDTAAKWKVNDIPGGDATVGTISAGLYTAPSLPPPGGLVTITAISLADTSKTDSVNVTVQFSNASVNGPYVFTMSGNTDGGAFYIAGRLVADGNGNIVSGIQDFRQAGLSLQMSLGGTYSIQPDGRGSLNILPEGSPEPFNIMFEATSNGEGLLLQLANSSTGSGQFYKQDADTFSTASMNGSYVMQVLGAESSGTTVAGVGVITCDGAGNLSGMQDVNTGKELLTKMSIDGTYSIDADGRAVVTTLAGTDTSETAMYLISSDRAVGVPLNAGSGGGTAVLEKQQVTIFNHADLMDNIVYVLTSEPATQATFEVGTFYSDMWANVEDGVYDRNNRGTMSQNVSFSGSYSIPVTDHGRGTMTITTPEGTEEAIFYLVELNRAFMIGTDTTNPMAGQIAGQQGVPFSTNSLQDKFVFSMRGFDALGGEIGVLGSSSLDGSGNFTGSEAVNHAGTLTPNETSSGTYSVSENGRGQLTMTVGGMEFTYTLYVVDSSHAFLMETDSSGAVLFGSMAAQF